MSGASWRLFLLLLLTTEYGMIFAYRAGRYDGFGALLMALVLWTMSIKVRSTTSGVTFCGLLVCSMGGAAISARPFRGGRCALRNISVGATGKRLLHRISLLWSVA